MYQFLFNQFSSCRNVHGFSSCAIQISYSLGHLSVKSIPGSGIDGYVMLNEARYKQVRLQGGCSSHHSLDNIWDPLGSGHSVISNILFFGRDIFLGIKLCALSSSSR